MSALPCSIVKGGRVAEIMVSLDDNLMRRLEHLAAAQGRSVETLARSAVRQYVARQDADEAAWRERLAALIAQIHQNLPADILPAEVDADVTAAREEVRQARRAARGH